MSAGDTTKQAQTTEETAGDVQVVVGKSADYSGTGCYHRENATRTLKSRCGTVANGQRLPRGTASSLGLTACPECWGDQR